MKRILSGLYGLLVFGIFSVLVNAAVDDKATLGYDSANNRDIIRVNSSGHLVPGADDTYALGTSSLRFSDLQTMDLTLGDDLSTSGDTTIGSASDDLLDLNVSSVTINGTTTAIVISSHTAIGAKTMKIDGANNRVCIGCSSATLPATTLDVESGVVQVSTSPTSQIDMCIAGAFQTLPTSGYGEGCLAYQNSTNSIYIATETVANAGSWVILN